MTQGGDRGPAEPEGEAAARELRGLEHDWGCGWEATRQRRLSAGLAVTAAQRLAWLEEMIELAAACGALPRARS